MTSQPWETQRTGTKLAPRDVANESKVVSPSILLVAAVAFFLGSYLPWQPVDLSNVFDRFDSRPAAEYRIEKSSWILLVEETADRSRFPWLATVQSDRAFWDSLKAAGYTWQFYDIDSPSVESYREDATKAGLPALLVVSPLGRVKLAKSCPPTVASIDEALRGIR